MNCRHSLFGMELKSKMRKSLDFNNVYASDVMMRIQRNRQIGGKYYWFFIFEIFYTHSQKSTEKRVLFSLQLSLFAGVCVIKTVRSCYFYFTSLLSQNIYMRNILRQEMLNVRFNECEKVMFILIVIDWVLKGNNVK